MEEERSKKKVKGKEDRGERSKIYLPGARGEGEDRKTDEEREEWMEEVSNG